MQNAIIDVQNVVPVGQLPNGHSLRGHVLF